MEPFLGEIRMVGYYFAPQGWAFCNGQLLSIAQNTALFSLLGTTYGGNDQTTFAFPDLRGRLPVHAAGGQGNGLTNRILGEPFGQDSVTLTPQEMPAHAHAVPIASAQSSDRPSAGLAPAPGGSYGSPSSIVPGQQVGGNQPHENAQPSLGVNFVIALEGIYPSRN